MIFTGLAVMHGQAVITGTRVPVSVIPDCLAAGVTSEQVTAGNPAVTQARRAAAAAAAAVRFKLDENLPAPAAGVLTRTGYDAGTVTGDGLQGVPDPDVVAAAAADGRVLITLDQGMGDIRAYPPGSHAGIVVLRLADQSATTVIRAINDLASLAQPGSLPGAVAVLQRGLLRIRHR
jgi:predicted nuclease of predicted toxin-antitoxin system